MTAYLALAAGVLLKGPIGVVLPAAAMSVYLLLELGLPSPRRWRSWAAALGELGVWWGVPLVAALTLPWFTWANRASEGEFFRVFLWHHNIERGSGGSSLRSNPWWFYFPQFLGDFLPWSLVFPLAVWWSYRRGFWRTDADARFGLVWFVSVLLVLSCSRFKRADYLLPAYPGAAVFLGCVGQHWLRELPRQEAIIRCRGSRRPRRHHGCRVVGACRVAVARPGAVPRLSRLRRAAFGSSPLSRKRSSFSAPRRILWHFAWVGLRALSYNGEN